MLQNCQTYRAKRTFLNVALFWTFQIWWHAQYETHFFSIFVACCLLLLFALAAEPVINATGPKITLMTALLGPSWGIFGVHVCRHARCFCNCFEKPLPKRVGETFPGHILPKSIFAGTRSIITISRAKFETTSGL